MKTRIISSLYMIPLLYVLHIAGSPLYIVETLLICQCLKEYREAFIGKYADLVKGNRLCILCIFLILLNILPLRYKFSVMLFTLLMMLSLTFLKQYEKEKHRHELLFWIGIVYIMLGFDSIVWIRISYPKGELFAYMIFVITIVSDSMAYFTGKIFGKTKLVPSISPNKTVEGSVGAIIFTVIACLLYNHFLIGMTTMHVVLIGVLGSIVSQLGDLVASRIKRMIGIKDFGNLIPEHGGVLDRLDSAILVSQFMLIGLYFLIL